MLRLEKERRTSAHDGVMCGGEIHAVFVDHERSGDRLTGAHTLTGESGPSDGFGWLVGANEVIRQRRLQIAGLAGQVVVASRPPVHVLP